MSNQTLKSAPKNSPFALQFLKEDHIFQFERKNYIVVNFDDNLIFENKYGEKFAIVKTENGVALGESLEKVNTNSIASMYKRIQTVKYPELEDEETIQLNIKNLEFELEHMHSSLGQILAQLKKYNANLDEIKILEKIANLASSKK